MTIQNNGKYFEKVFAKVTEMNELINIETLII